ncbi:MAG: hypothetical protein IPK91_00855 [Saprospiraceae bacterium]|nr:hypothetical protein [Saprospiraceae bacterium]MBK8295847.1 hypothetical protein [Saprospiraceae bacterium]
MDHKDCSGLMGRCKNCNHYCPFSAVHKYGTCALVYANHLTSGDMPFAQIIHIEQESLFFTKSKVYVMEDFGCIHFLKKTSEPLVVNRLTCFYEHICGIT